MTGYLIDTDLVIDHLHEDVSATNRIEVLESEDLYISMVTYMEVWQGLLREPDPRVAQAKFEALLERIDLAPFSVEVARRCAVLREDLRLRGRRVRSRFLDLIAAATALEHGLSLVTRNTDDYADIPDLILG